MMKKNLIAAIALFIFSTTAFALPSYKTVEDCDGACQFQLDVENLKAELSQEFRKELKADIEKQIAQRNSNTEDADRSES